MGPEIGNVECVLMNDSWFLMLPGLTVPAKAICGKDVRGRVKIDEGRREDRWGQSTHTSGVVRAYALYH